MQPATRTSADEISCALDKILPFVQKPARYTGGEFNAVTKVWDTTACRLALVFPDVYDLGMSNLGLMILYDIVNKQPDMLAERAFTPWVDMLAAMRQAGIPLYSLESRHPLREFDVIGFGLPCEQLYTNVLTTLDVAGVPLRSAARGDDVPLILAGGSACLNPEPMHAFFDAFLAGEGEDAIIEILRTWSDARRQGLSRVEGLRRLARIRGMYVPYFYEVSYHEDGTLSAVLPKVQYADVAPKQITKRIVPVLPPPPTKLIVPFVDVVHNRGAVEIQRGCTRGCRFCQAGMVYRPVRERPLEQVLMAIEDLVQDTGFEEVSLLSLSSSDYSAISELVARIAERHSDDGLSIGLPSLRIESVSVDLMQKLEQGRKRSGFTFAPEAATDRLREVINKPIATQELLDVAGEVFSRGWPSVKLYFMIGHPTQTLDDVEAIADLTHQVRRIGYQTLGRRSTVRVGVSTLVPKAHTPFQWLPMADEDTIRQQIGLLERRLRGPGLEFSWNNPRETLLEAALSRGDRRLSDVIQRAWELGAGFDGWGDQFNEAAWSRAFSDMGLDPNWYARRERTLDEVLPWDHIHAGVSKAFLMREYRKAAAGRVTADCRQYPRTGRPSGQTPWPQPSAEPQPVDAATKRRVAQACQACGIMPLFREERLAVGNDAWSCPPARYRSAT